MTDFAQISALVGFLLPIIIAVIQQPRFTRLMRTIVAIVCSLIAAVITAWADPSVDLTWHTWSTAAIFIGLTAMTTYKRVWVPVGAASMIELKTSPKDQLVRNKKTI